MTNTPRDPWLAVRPASHDTSKASAGPEPAEIPTDDKAAGAESQQRGDALAATPAPSGADQQPAGGPPLRHNAPAAPGALPGQPPAEPGEATLRDKAAAAPAGETWRTFIAIELPEAVRVVVAGLRHKMPRASFETVRWVHPSAMHVTLRFLGEVTPAREVAIAGELAAAAARSSGFVVRAGATGVFPGAARARVLWVGFTGDIQHFMQLQGRVEGAVAKLDFEPERQKFTPHVTAGRLDDRVAPYLSGQAGRAWAALRLPPGLADFRVASVVLFRSHAGPAGPRYEKLAEAPLS
jgi:2'-5' RNA ligase